MKRVRFGILCFMALFCGLSVFSYISGLEDGDCSHWLGIAGIAVGVATYFLAKHWDKKGMLPDNLMDRDNDKA